MAQTTEPDSDPSTEQEQTKTESNLAELTAKSDLVAIVQVFETDYQKTREFPSSGIGYLKVLIPYKGAEKGDLIQVKEKGLADDACYYPEIEVLQLEGDRFLVFLKKDGPKLETYHGYAPACKIPVFVTQDNSYAIGYPVTGVDLPEQYVKDIQYGDPAAMLDLTEWSSSQSEEYANTYRLKPVVPGPEYQENAKIYIYTQGIPVPGLYKLLFPDGKKIKVRQM